MRVLTRGIVGISWCAISVAVGCSDSSSKPGLGGGDGGSAGTGGSGGSAGSGSGEAGSGTSGSAGSGGTIVVGSSGGSGSGGTGIGGGTYTLPSDFTEADVGGWKLGEIVTGDDPGAGAGGAGDGGCGNTLTGVVRDFHGSDERHPDMELPDGYGPLKGIVEQLLGSDRKPVYAPDGATIATTGEAAFDQWYRTDPTVNQAFRLTLFLMPKDNGVFSFESSAFFPLDDAGFGNEYQTHNYHFTFELHTEFKYKGGEKFTFIGDDDVFVFINDRLALDLGGIHTKETGEIDVDAQATDLGLELGQTYALEMFQAERHTSESNFRIDTTLEFTNCGVIVPDVPK